MDELTGKVRAALQKYQMIEAGDRVAVGVSGGKDSVFLLCALKKLSEYYPLPFTVAAITADPCFGGSETDFSGVEKLCEELGVQYIIRRTQLGRIVFEENGGESPCSLCARMRRGILHNMCKENGFNKLALGHHEDDAVQTMLMNLFYSGKIGCFSPVTYLSRKELYLIRPMIFCGENEIKNAVSRMGLPVVKSLCPADGQTARTSAGQLVSELQRDFPDVKAKILGAMQRAGLNGW